MKFTIFLVSLAIFYCSCQKEEPLKITILENSVVYSGSNYCCGGGFIREDSSRVIPINLDELIKGSVINTGDTTRIKYYFVESAIACPAYCASLDAGFIKLIEIKFIGR